LKYLATCRIICRPRPPLMSGSVSKYRVRRLHNDKSPTRDAFRQKYWPSESDEDTGNGVMVWMSVRLRTPIPIPFQRTRLHDAAGFLEMRSYRSFGSQAAKRPVCLVSDVSFAAQRA